MEQPRRPPKIRFHMYLTTDDHRLAQERANVRHGGVIAHYVRDLIRADHERASKRPAS